jgi:hypothetical protein
MIATEGNEMALSGLLKSLQTPRHKGRLRPETTPLKPKPGLNGPPLTLETPRVPVRSQPQRLRRKTESVIAIYLQVSVHSGELTSCFLLLIG